MKHNKSIEGLSFQIFEHPLHQALMVSIGYFLRHNPKMRRLIFMGEEEDAPLSMHQAREIAQAIEHTELRMIRLDGRFETNGAFEAIIMACTKASKLEIYVRRDFQYSVIAGLLRDTHAKLEYLTTDGWSDQPFDIWTVFDEIAQSLVGHSSLKTMSAFELFENDNGVTHCFDEVLCDTSSIDAIYHSNHTLERISHWNTSDLTKRCLELNKNENKDKVIREKILQFYFTADFNIAPFGIMALSLLPNVMNQIKGPDRQSAILRLLKSIPELCFVSSRKMSKHISSIDSSHKRQKVGK